MFETDFKAYLFKQCFMKKCVSTCEFLYLSAYFHQVWLLKTMSLEEMWRNKNALIIIIIVSHAGFEPTVRGLCPLT